MAKKRVIIIDIFIIIDSKNSVSKAKIPAIYFGFIAYVKVNCMITIANKMAGRNGDYTVVGFLLSI